jgi:hypothetical protein
MALDDLSIAYRGGSRQVMTSSTSSISSGTSSMIEDGTDPLSGAVLCPPYQGADAAKIRCQREGGEAAMQRKLSQSGSNG